MHSARCWARASRWDEQIDFSAFTDLEKNKHSFPPPQGLLPPRAQIFPSAMYAAYGLRRLARTALPPNASGSAGAVACGAPTASGSLSCAGACALGLPDAAPRTLGLAGALGFVALRRATGGVLGLPLALLCLPAAAACACRRRQRLHPLDVSRYLQAGSELGGRPVFGLNGFQSKGALTSPLQDILAQLEGCLGRHEWCVHGEPRELGPDNTVVLHGLPHRFQPGRPMLPAHLATQLCAPLTCSSAQQQCQQRRTAGQSGQVGGGPARRQPAVRGGSGARQGGGAQLAPKPNGLTTDLAVDLADTLGPWPDVRSRRVGHQQLRHRGHICQRASGPLAEGPSPALPAPASASAASALGWSAGASPSFASAASEERSVCSTCSAAACAVKFRPRPGSLPVEMRSSAGSAAPGCGGGPKP